jgi:hypothetical protein
MLIRVIWLEPQEAHNAPSVLKHPVVPLNQATRSQQWPRRNQSRSLQDQALTWVRTRAEDHHKNRNFRLCVGGTQRGYYPSSTCAATTKDSKMVSGLNLNAMRRHTRWAAAHLHLFHPSSFNSKVAFRSPALLFQSQSQLLITWIREYKSSRHHLIN